jgi:pimeloyl-ACP methyl ester carboxylesterase
MEVLRTPDDRFAGLAGYGFEPHYLDWEGLRLHYIDEGQSGAPVMLLFHGEPTWAYLYHRMIPPLVAAGYRCIAPDYIGFGRSDKVTDEAWYTIERREGHDQEAAARAYDAPFPNYDSKAGARRFPWLLPFAQPEEGNAADQARCYDALTRWDKPAHLIFGDADGIFTVEWAREWASRIPGATVDAIPDAGHFVQHDAGEDVVDVLLRRIGEE